MKNQIKISGQDKMKCINENNLTYNRSMIMSIAWKTYRFNKLFDKSLTFGEVLSAVWKSAIELMKRYRINAVKEVENQYISIDPKHSLIA